MFTNFTFIYFTKSSASLPSCKMSNNLLILRLFILRHDSRVYQHVKRKMVYLFIYFINRYRGLKFLIWKRARVLMQKYSGVEQPSNYSGGRGDLRYIAFLKVPSKIGYNVSL